MLWSGLKFLLRNPNVWFALVATVNTCLSHALYGDSKVSKLVYNRQGCVTQCIIVNYFVYSYLETKDIVIIQHLVGLNFISHVFSHCSKLLKSACNSL